MANNHVEFCGLLTHYFAADGIQLKFRYPSHWSLTDSGLRVWLCSHSEHDRLIRAAVRPDSSAVPADGDSGWVQATLEVPPAELGGLGSGEYWLRCERLGGGDGGGGSVMLGQCESFIICLEPRDIPATKAPNGEGGGEGERCPLSIADAANDESEQLRSLSATPSASIGSGSFVLVDDEEGDEFGEREKGDAPMETPGVVASCPRRQGDQTHHEEEDNEREGEEERSLKAPRRPLRAPTTTVIITATNTTTTTGMQTDTVSDSGQQDVTERGSQTDPHQDQPQQELQRQQRFVGENSEMIASTVHVSALSEAEVSVLRSNNRDLLTKVRKLADLVRDLEGWKHGEEARVAVELERALGPLRARLLESEEREQLLRSQLSLEEAERVSLVAERDGLEVEKVRLETERDRFCAETLQLKDECATLREGKGALEVELLGATEELRGAREKVVEMEEALGVSTEKVKCLYERVTQLEGKVLSKENEVKVAMEKLEECRRQLRVHGDKGVGLEGGRRRSLEGGGEGKQLNKSSRSKTLMGTSAILPPNTTTSGLLGDRPGEGSSGSHPHLHPPRPKDEFVTGVDQKRVATATRKDRPRTLSTSDHHHHRGTHQLPQGPQTSSTAVGRASFALPKDLAMPTTTSSKRRPTAGEREVPQWEGGDKGTSPCYTCPVCQKELQCLSELSATVHIEECLATFGKGGDRAKVVPDGGDDLLFSRTY